MLGCYVLLLLLLLFLGPSDSLLVSNHTYPIIVNIMSSSLMSPRQPLLRLLLLHIAPQWHGYPMELAISGTQFLYHDSD